MLETEGVSQADLMVVSEQFFKALHGQSSSSSMTQTRSNLYIRKQGNQCALYATYIYIYTAADALEHLPPRDWITCLSMDSGPPGCI